MARYVALLRAVNVGKRKVKMDHLRELLGELGLDEVGTYIQTGNAFFDSTRRDRAKLTAEIEKCLEDDLGFAVPVLLRTTTELEKAIALDPFKKAPPVSDDIRHVVLFVDKALPKSVKLPHKSAKDEFEVIASTKGELFVVLHRLGGKTGNPAAWVEKEHGLVATARWFHTTAKILEAAQK